MTLHELLKRVSFDDVFSDILRWVPDAEDKREVFQTAFNTLREIKPGKSDDIVVEPDFLGWLGKGVHDTYIYARSGESVRVSDVLAVQIDKRRLLESRRADASLSDISDEAIVADCLWQLVGYGYPNESAALNGYFLCGQRWRQTSREKIIEEICSYLSLHSVKDLSRKDIVAYRKAQNIAVFGHITPYSLPLNKAAYQTICFLDDYMWYNNETKTIVVISASEGYQSEVSEIEEFINSDLKNPTIIYGQPLLPGIAVNAIFITE